MFHLEQVNKEFNSLANRLGSEDISIGDPEVAPPQAKDGLSEEVQRQGDLRLDETGVEQQVQLTKGRVDQLRTSSGRGDPGPRYYSQLQHARAGGAGAVEGIRSPITFWKKVAATIRIP